MQKFTRAVCRTVTIKSGDRAVPDVDWVIEFSERGLRVWRKGTQTKTHKDWKRVIGDVLVNGSTGS